jgi:transposase-like protein
MRCIKIRGKKGVPHTDPDDPPRRRANKIKGHGTWRNDRPPVLGVVGRESGEVRLEAIHSSGRAWIEPRVVIVTTPGAHVHTDEWHAYNHLPEQDRKHSSVKHNPSHPEWARDDDGDGIREVHCNTMEGIWTGLRNFLRPFRGVSKIYLGSYTAMFQWAHNLKSVTDHFLRVLLSLAPTTSLGP